MQTAAIRNQRLLALLLSRWEIAYGVFGPDRLIRLQRLWSMLPDNCKLLDLQRFLCPIFSMDAQQQVEFNNLFDELARDLHLLKHPPTSTELSPLEKEKQAVEPDLQLENVRPPLVVSLDECVDPPYSWNIVSNQENISVEMPVGWGHTLRKLRRHKLTNRLAIDIPASILATIRQAGMPNFRFRQFARSPEYLLLVERFSQHDHRAGLFDYLYNSMFANQVHVECFYYTGDIRLCRNKKYPAGLKPHELYYRFPNACLLVIGSGHRFINPLTSHLADWMSILKAWPIRVLFTPVSHNNWGRQENLLQHIFTLLPISLQSLQYVSNMTERFLSPYEAQPSLIRRFNEVKPIALEEPLIRSLHRHFNSDMLCWIAACAIFPTLHYALTLHLGRLLSRLSGYNLVTVENLLTLARLPWFTSGNIPECYRDQLIDYFANRHPERHQAVLQYLRKLMEENPPPANSVAWAEHQINLAFLRIKLDSMVNAEDFGQLHEVIKRLNRPQRRTDFILPEKWEKFIEKIELDESVGSTRTETYEKELSSIQAINEKTSDSLVDALRAGSADFGADEYNAFYRSSYGWVIFFKDQMVTLNGNQENGLICLHHLLSHPNIDFSIESMAFVVEKSKLKQKKKRQKGIDTENIDFDEIEPDTHLSLRGFQITAEQLWQEVNPMGDEASLQEALTRYEEKSAFAFSKEAFIDLLPMDKQLALMQLLHALANQRFILLQLFRRFKNQKYQDKIKAVEKQINAITFYLKEGPEINPYSDALEDFVDIRIELYDANSLRTTIFGKPREVRMKDYQNITKSIKRAISSVESEELQNHLHNHIHIGEPCCYRIGSLKIEWITEEMKNEVIAETVPTIIDTPASNPDDTVSDSTKYLRIGAILSAVFAMRNSDSDHVDVLLQNLNLTKEEKEYFIRQLDEEVQHNRVKEKVFQSVVKHFQINIDEIFNQIAPKYYKETPQQIFDQLDKLFESKEIDKKEN